MTEPEADDRGREGLDHLQAAAVELIGAGRAFLDVAESLVREPGALGSVVSTLGAFLGDLRPDHSHEDDPTGAPSPKSRVRRVDLS